MWPFLSRHKWIVAYLIIIGGIFVFLFITGLVYLLPPSWGIVAIVIAIIGFLITHLSTLDRSKENEIQEEKTDRLVKEMEKLVAPMYSKIGDINIYLKGSPGYKASNSTSVQEYFRFWSDVKQSKYLAPDYLRSAIDNYLKNKSQTVRDRKKDESYEKAETQLLEAIKRRYSELEQLV